MSLMEANRARLRTRLQIQTREVTSERLFAHVE
jgi:hypothetical protein